MRIFLPAFGSVTNKRTPLDAKNNIACCNGHLNCNLQECKTDQKKYQEKHSLTCIIIFYIIQKNSDGRVMSVTRQTNHYANLSKVKYLIICIECYIKNVHFHVCPRERHQKGITKAPPCSEIKVFVQLCEPIDDTNIQLAQEVCAASVHPHVSYFLFQLHVRAATSCPDGLTWILTRSSKYLETHGLASITRVVPHQQAKLITYIVFVLFFVEESYSF